MKLVEISIKKRITLTMIYLIVVGFALFSFSQLKVDLFPNIDFPIVGIVTEYKGVGPEDIENLIARPIEEAVSATKNVKNVKSQISQGVCVTTLEFDWGTDMTKAENDVRKRIDMIRKYLPNDATDPVTFAFDPSMMPIAFILISSPDMGPAELHKLGTDRVEPLLERVDGVAMVETAGGLERQINVKLNPVKLAAHQLSTSDVVRAIRASGGLLPAGSIETATTNFSLHIASNYQTLDQVKQVIIKYEKGRPLVLGDVADVEDGFKEVVSDVRVNYHQGVYLRVFKQSDANTVQACRNVRNALKDIRKMMPRDVQLRMVYDQSEYIMSAIGNLGDTALLAFLIAFAVIYFFLRNIRGSIIMGLAIPISVVSTFAVMMLAHLTLNIISMAGLALAIGMLVDNSIVVLENVYRHREMGEDLVTAANVGTTEVAMAITASTLTTIGVFLPVLFVPGIAGQLFNDMVVTITFSLFASLIIALTLVPMLGSRILRLENEMPRQRLKKFKEKIGNFLDNLTNWYVGVLRWSLQNKTKVLLATTVLFALSLLTIRVIGGDFLPKSDQGFIALTVLREKGTPLNETRKTVLQLEKIVKDDIPEATDVLAMFGQGEGIFAFFGGTGSEAINFRIRLKPMEERSRSQEEIEKVLREKLDQLPGITYQFLQTNMFSSDRAVDVKIFGNDIEKSKQIAEKLKSKMEKIKGLVDVEVNMKEGGKEILIVPDRRRLNDLKLSALQVADIISTAIQGKVAARFYDKGDEYDIMVRLEKPYRQSKEALRHLLIPTISGKMVQLQQVASIEETHAPSTIYRENQQRYVSVGCDLSGIDLSSAVRKIQHVIDQAHIPSEFQVVIGGTAKDQRESFMYLTIAFFAAVLLVYMIMASEFESLLAPFIIMFTVPLSVIGVFGMLFITGTKLDVMALVGIVMLVGIVVNNGIVLVDYINQLRRKGYDLLTAVQEGGRVRLRPVLMTASTTILGMVPLALKLGSGSENWTPLARAVIGGLTTSTVLTLVIVPILYVLLEKTGDKVRQWWLKKV